jgi:hypothetical protein
MRYVSDVWVDGGLAQGELRKKISQPLNASTLAICVANLPNSPGLNCGGGMYFCRLGGAVGGWVLEVCIREGGIVVEGGCMLEGRRS